MKNDRRSILRAYQAPHVYDIGRVADLTRQSIDKCGGSGDALQPQLPVALSPIFAEDCDALP